MGRPAASPAPPASPVPAVPRRRHVSFAAISLCVALSPSAGAQVAPGSPAGVGSPVAPGVRADAGRPGVGEPVAGPDAAPDAAPLSGPRARKKAVTEGAWYLFFVTAGALAGLVAVIWLFGFYKRQFLDDDPPGAELFDARTRAEIERHRKEVQAEAARAKAEAERDGADQNGAEKSDANPTPNQTSDGTTHDDARDTLDEQTAAAPDPAVRPDTAVRPEPAGRDDRPPA